MTTTSSISPAVSVCIPTFKRLDLLKRAVESVLAQTFDDWELLISDDEDPAGETWEYLQGLSRTDSRIKVMQNTGDHGQVGNMNNLLLQATAPWIKPLYDDDVLKPDCLETFLRAARAVNDVAIVTCLIDHYVHGKRTRRGRPLGTAEFEFTPKRYVPLGMYLLDCPGGVPTQIMVSRHAIESGALMEKPPGIHFAVDSWWNLKLARFGGLLRINRVLAEFHQGSHESFSGSESPEVIEAEYRVLRAEQLKWIEPSLNPPPLKVANGMVNAIRVLRYVNECRPFAALKLGSKVYYPRSWYLAFRWLANQRVPGRFSIVPHHSIAIQSES